MSKRKATLSLMLVLALAVVAVGLFILARYVVILLGLQAQNILLADIETAGRGDSMAVLLISTNNGVSYMEALGTYNAMKAAGLADKPDGFKDALELVTKGTYYFTLTEGGNLVLDEGEKPRNLEEKEKLEVYIPLPGGKEGGLKEVAGLV